MTIPVDRLDRLWRRHGRTFWILHSIWALATGVVILWLAHERYGFVYWVVGFLALTWTSTLVFSRRLAGGEPAQFSTRVKRGRASYLTRVLYQETLFFLLPFYAYSTVLHTWNLTFVVLLGLLAILSCLDLLFDGWLRTSPVFGLVFFASVAFGALNLLLPMLLSMNPSIATPVAAVLALATAAPLATQARVGGLWAWARVSAAGLVILVVAVWLPTLVPPVPLRLQEIAFAAGLERATLQPVRPVEDDVSGGELAGQLVVLARVFAPVNVPARIALDWYVDGALVRTSREVEILAHEGGFRFWDVLRPEGGTLSPGVYRVVLRTTDDRVFGSASVSVR
jgi:hypothetical protein